MKENILKLLQSTVLEDVILAITLAYELSSEEFKEIFADGHMSQRLDLYNYKSIAYEFTRDGIDYSFGIAGAGLHMRYSHNYIDITPEQYKTN